MLCIGQLLFLTIDTADDPVNRAKVEAERLEKEKADAELKAKAEAEWVDLVNREGLCSVSDNYFFWLLMDSYNRAKAEAERLEKEKAEAELKVKAEAKWVDLVYRGICALAPPNYLGLSWMVMILSIEQKPKLSGLKRKSQTQSEYRWFEFGRFDVTHNSDTDNMLCMLWL